MRIYKLIKNATDLFKGKETWIDSKGEVVYVKGISSLKHGGLSRWEFNEGKDMQKGTITKSYPDGTEKTFYPPFSKVEDEKVEELEIPPSYGYHITYVSRLNNILKRGIVLPKSMNPSWVRTYPENAIYLFTEPKYANFFANHIDLDRHKDWVILRVDNLDPQYIGPDHDFGNSWKESIRNSNSFSYSKSIPLRDIKVFDKAEGTDMERRDEFERLLR